MKLYPERDGIGACRFAAGALITALLALRAIWKSNWIRPSSMTSTDCIVSLRKPT